jgi:hypothetical protein
VESWEKKEVSEREDAEAEGDGKREGGAEARGLEKPQVLKGKFIGWADLPPHYHLPHL